MSRRNPRAKWVLPEIINPDKRICFQIQVPDEKYHIAAFLGALYNLTSAIFWSDDPSHKAKDVARVWQEIYDNISRQCVTEFIATYVALEDDMPFFRQVCEDNKCYLEFECCPGEWVRLGRADQIPAGTQPGAGASQPQPGGGTAKYCSGLLASGRTYIPTILNAGDIISLTASGAGNGGASDPFPVRWYCPNGQDFFAGACVAGTLTNGSDPLPAEPHMSLVVNVDGTFYPFASGSFTVPAGVANAPAFIQVNDSNLSDNSGSYEICVIVQNNQTATWTHVFDLTLNAYSQYISLNSGNGIWIAGTGYQTTFQQLADGYRTVDMDFVPASTLNLTDIKVEFSYTPGTLASSGDSTFYLANNATPLINIITPTVPTSPQEYATPVTVSVKLFLQLIAGVCVGTCDPGGVATFTKLTLTGTGTDPF